MPVSPTLARVAAGQVAYGQPLGDPNQALQVTADALMHQWYRTRAVVWQYSPVVPFAATATTTPWVWRMHAPAGVTDFGLIVRGSMDAGTGTVELLRTTTVVATVTLTTTPQVLSDLTGTVSAGVDSTWSIRIAPGANTATVTDIWVVWPNITTP